MQTSWKIGHEQMDMGLDFKMEQDFIVQEQVDNHEYNRAMEQTIYPHVSFQILSEQSQEPVSLESAEPSSTKCIVWIIYGTEV